MQLYAYIPRNAIAALLCPRFVPCYGVIPGATSQSFFGLRHFHWYVWTTLGLKGKDVHLNWCDVLEPGFVFKKNVFFQKKLLETSPKVSVLIPKHYGVISEQLQRNFPALRRNFPAT